MGREALLEALGEQVAAEVEGNLERAREEAAVIVRNAETEARRHREQRLRRARAEVETERSRILNAARLEAGKRLLAVRHRIAEEILAAVREKLERLPCRPDYPLILERLLVECLLPENSLLLCRAQDRSLLGEIARRGGRKVRFEEGELPLGGLVVASEDGRFIQRNTFEGRMQKARPRLLTALAEGLFGGRDPVPGTS